MTVEQLDPPVGDDVLALAGRARQCRQAGDLRGALENLVEANRRAGEHPALLAEIAEVASAGGDHAAAEQLLRRVLALRPGGVPAVQLAICVYNRQRYAEAVQLFEAALPQVTITPQIANAYALALEKAGALAPARAVREQVLAQQPTPAHALELAQVLSRQGEQELLRQRLTDWLARWPEDPALLGYAAGHLLALGDYPQGFALLRRRLARVGHGIDDAALAACPAWDGRPFEGELLVRLEPHLGEEIQVTSLLAGLVAMHQRAQVEVDARLLRLCARAFPSLGFVARGQRALEARAAAGHCRLATTVDLAQAFDRRCTLPGTPGWFRPDPALLAAKKAAYDARWPGRRRIGISWRSARAMRGEDAKSIPLAALARTLSLPDMVFIDLQYGDAGAEVQALAQQGLPAPWRDPAVDTTQDLDALAAQLGALDHFVTISNTTAHLAGALGVPTTVLLPRTWPVLWHWGYQGEQTSWYGSVRLLRNPQEQGWEALDRALSERLALSI